MCRQPKEIDRAFDDAIEAFELDWNTRPPAVIANHMTSQHALLSELVSVDLEYRWRSERGSLQDELGCQPRLEDYVRHLKAFVAFTPTTANIVEEYRVRTIWGDRPSIAHFTHRFPNEATLTELFARTDAELRAEHTSGSLRKVEVDPRAPMQYEDFEILQMIGAGSVGKVYRCRQISLNRMVAIKALRKQHQRDDWVVDSFLREGQVLAGLEHPGIAQIFGMGRFPHGGYFQVVELLEGSNLRERLKNPEPISQESRLRLLGKLAEAIRFAHDQNVIHCDLKPENIMLVGDRVVLTDFGMAQLIKYDHHREILGGTPNYMAPELNDKDPKATAAIDVYAFGKIWDEVNASDSFAEPQALADLRKKCAATLPHERPTAPQLAIALNEHLLRLY